MELVPKMGVGIMCVLYHRDKNGVKVMEGMEADDLLCSRNARPEMDEEGSGQVPSLLAERAR